MKTLNASIPVNYRCSILFEGGLYVVQHNFNCKDGIVLYCSGLENCVCLLSLSFWTTLLYLNMEELTLNRSVNENNSHNKSVSSLFKTRI